MFVIIAIGGMKMKNLLRKSFIYKTPIVIVYIDKSNGISKRTIKLIQMNKAYVKAYCYKRRAVRTFKIDNILAAFPSFQNEAS